MVAMAMRHDTDPKQDIFNRFGDLSGLSLLHSGVLVATYVRPNKTKGGILLTDNTRKEDEYQGKVGLVLAKGPGAFVDDDEIKFHGQNIEVGDWVWYQASSGRQMSVKGQHCRLLDDTAIRGKVEDPDLIY